MGRGSDSLPVEVDLFGVTTWLADSMQFMLEYGCRLNANGSYYIMPSFRGETPDETHLSQFFHSEAEIPGTLDDVIACVEGYVAYLCGVMLDAAADDICVFTGHLSHLDEMAHLTDPLPRVTFNEATDLLADSPDGLVTAPDGTIRTLTRAGERQLMARFGGAVWVTHFDHLSVPFYQAFTGPDQTTACNADLLFGIGETVGAGERHVDDVQLSRALALHEVDPAPYEWYRTMKRMAPLRTSGFGMGIERFLLWALRHTDIRDLQLFPRANGIQLVP